VVNNTDELPPSQPEEKGDEEDGPTLRDPAVSESDPFADAFPDSPSPEDPATAEAWQGPSDPSGPATFSLEDLMEPSAPPKAAKKVESKQLGRGIEEAMMRSRYQIDALETALGRAGDPVLEATFNKLDPNERSRLAAMHESNPKSAFKELVNHPTAPKRNDWDAPIKKVFNWFMGNK
jgi:hypothetical protein